LLRAFLPGLLVGAIAGCGGNDVCPVEGVVVYPDGSPATDLENHVVTFELVDPEASSDQPGVSASGAVKADGTFTLGTYEIDDGAAPGKHRVALSPEVQVSDETIVKEVLDPKFYAFDTSGLEVTITPGTNEVKLPVQRRKRE
jgi:hypothetical protein